MATEREIALEQAVLAVIAAGSELGLDVKDIALKAKGLVLGDSRYRQVDHPYIMMAGGEIDASASLVLQLKRS